ncbi:hypothetical protein LV779_11235 [Streptomyces thinghirensis]|nr:hypothetical protein [Streptomyces thinghirensis]
MTALWLACVWFAVRAGRGRRTARTTAACLTVLILLLAARSRSSTRCTAASPSSWPRFWRSRGCSCCTRPPPRRVRPRPAGRRGERGMTHPPYDGPESPESELREPGTAAPAAARTPGSSIRSPSQSATPRCSARVT